MSPTKGATSAILDNIFKKIAALKAQKFKPTKLIVKMQNNLTVFLGSFSTVKIVSNLGKSIYKVYCKFILSVLKEKITLIYFKFERDSTVFLEQVALC